VVPRRGLGVPLMGLHAITRPPCRCPACARRRAVARAWRLAWSSRSPARSAAAWWLAWHMAGRYFGFAAGSPGGCRLPAVPCPAAVGGGVHAPALWLLPPGSAFAWVRG